MKTIFAIFMSMYISLSAQIFDCFPFFNELDLLEVRLNELCNHVDKFILVEWTETHSGKPKPLYYEENKERFQKFSDKIVHIVLTNHMETTINWDRENYQREQIMQGLAKCNPKPHDIIIVSDLDEIVRAQSISNIAKALRINPVVGCSHRWYVGYLNMRCRDNWDGAIATTWKYLMKNHPSLTQLRLDHHLGHKFPVIKNGGWHFSWLGGHELVVKKLESYAHQEDDIPENKTGNFVFIRHKDQDLKLEKIGASFPNFIQENREYFIEIGFIYN